MSIQCYPQVLPQGTATVAVISKSSFVIWIEVWHRREQYHQLIWMVLKLINCLICVMSENKRKKYPPSFPRAQHDIFTYFLCPINTLQTQRSSIYFNIKQKHAECILTNHKNRPWLCFWQLFLLYWSDNAQKNNMTDPLCCGGFYTALFIFVIFCWAVCVWHGRLNCLCV